MVEETDDTQDDDASTTDGIYLKPDDTVYGVSNENATPAPGDNDVCFTFPGKKVNVTAKGDWYAVNCILDMILEIIHVLFSFFF